MSFDEFFWNKRESSPKKYPYSLATFKLMKHSLRADFSEKSKELIRNYMSECQKKPEKVVPKEELLEMRELKMEMHRLQGFVRDSTDRLNAKNYGTKLSILFNFFGLFVMLCAFYWNDRDGVELYNWLDYRLAFIIFYAFCVVLLTASGVIGYHPIQNDDEKIKKRFDFMKKKMKAKYTLAQLLKEQKKIFRLFLKDYITLITRYEEVCSNRFNMLCLNSLPMVLFLVNCFCYFGIRAFKNGNENGDGHIILNLMLWLFMSLLFVFPGCDKVAEELKTAKTGK
ncbi:unnamed protein product [Caenorhabditis brenneri]